MKLWQVIQWGNINDGPDGLDTQCIISAVDMMSAIGKAEDHFPSWKHYSRGPGFDSFEHRSDVVYLLGEDNKVDGEPILVTRVWVCMADNPAHNLAWYREWDTNQWRTQMEMYGE